MTLARRAAAAARGAVALLAACAGTPAHPPAPAPACAPQPQDATMLAHDDSIAPPAVFAIELALSPEPAASGRVRLRLTHRGNAPVTLAVPARSDQVEWFDPTTRPLVAPTPRVAWRAGTAALALDSRASLAQRAASPVTLLPGGAHEVAVDLGAALDGLYGPGALARGWCARAWLIGGVHPLPSNIVCWPAD